MPVKDVHLTLRVPNGLRQALDKIAAERRRSRSEIAQFALEEFVDKAGQR